MCLGTCWKALDIKALRELRILLSSALISNSRALMKDAILSSPFADTDVPRWMGIARASWAFCRLRACEVKAGLSNATFRFLPATWEGGFMTFYDL